MDKAMDTSSTAIAQSAPIRFRKASSKGLVSIQWTLPVLVIMPLVAGVGITGWLAFHSGQLAVNVLVDRLSNEIAGRINQRVEEYLAKPQQVQDAIAAGYASGNLDLEDAIAVRRYFWQITLSANLVSNLYIGRESDGRFIGAERSADGSFLWLRDESTNNRWITFRMDDQGNPTERMSEFEYDPRQRPWYQEAVAQGTATWSSVYLSVEPPTLALTRALPLMGPDGQLVGVMGIDLVLTELSAFLQALEVSENGEAFIIERSGDLVASSGNEKPFILENDQQSRLPAVDSKVPLIRATAEYLEGEFGDFTGAFPEETIVFNLEDERQLVRVSTLEGMSDLDWLIVVVMPESDFMGYIRANTQSTLIIGGIITAIATLLGLIAAMWIIRPIQRLNQAAQQIEENSFQPNSLEGVIARPDEFGELAHLFRDMAMVVASRQQSLAEQVNALQEEINSSKLSRSERAQLETLLERAKQARGISK